MKKIIAMLLVAGLAVMTMTGCGSQEKVIGGEVSNAPSNEVQAAANTAQDAAEGEAATDNAEKAKGYVFAVQGVTVAVDSDAAETVAALGEPLSYFEAESCAFKGLDKMYTYSGFEIETYPTDNKDFVSNIRLKDDSVSTVEGLCIGDSLEKVQQTYGGGAEENGMVVYEKDGMKLCFIIKADEVASIEYRSTVLD